MIMPPVLSGAGGLFCIGRQTSCQTRVAVVREWRHRLRITIMKRLIIVSLLALAPLMAACHTVQGVGQDITAVGKGMERATH